MKKILISLLIVMSLISCNSKNENQFVNEKNVVIEKQIIVDVEKIAGKNKKEIDNILGKCDRIEQFSETSTPCKDVSCKKAYYQKNKYEIIFINGKSDWITINDLSEYDFTEDNIELFGLPFSEPNFKNPQDLIRWKNIENINEINIFNNGSGKISYAYIKVKTE